MKLMTYYLGILLEKSGLNYETDDLLSWDSFGEKKKTKIPWRPFNVKVYLH